MSHTYKYQIMDAATPISGNTKTQTKLRGLSPRANYTDRAAAAGQRS